MVGRTQDSLVVGSVSIGRLVVIVERTEEGDRIGDGVRITWVSDSCMRTPRSRCGREWETLLDFCLGIMRGCSTSR